MRTLTNVGLVVGIFAVGALLVSPFEWAWFADLALIGVLYYVFFYVLQNRAVGIDCPHCHKYIATNTPWRCGFCHASNRRVNEFPFVHQCEHCQAEPKAYQCHHCKELIYLGDDRLDHSFATCLNAPAQDSVQEEISKQERERRDLQHKLLKARLTAELNAVEKIANPPAEKSRKEVLEESLRKHQAITTEVERMVRRGKAANAEEFKDDPDELERQNAWLEQWANEQRTTM